MPGVECGHRVWKAEAEEIRAGFYAQDAEVRALLDASSVWRSEISDSFSFLSILRFENSIFWCPSFRRATDRTSVVDPTYIGR